MIEPIRDQLDSGVQSDRMDRDDSWTQSLREEIEDAEVDIVPVLGKSSLTLGRLVDLKPGDVIPCDFDGNVTLYAEGVPVLRGSYRRLPRPAGSQGHAADSRHKMPVLSNVVIGAKQ
jgi:flagellar motor switch protein FliM